MDKFNNKYRIPSARLQSWDYGANGAYFITICTKHRQHFFGEIVETPKLGVSTQGVSNQGVSNIDADNIETPKLGVSTMQLNELGQLAETYWMEIPKHYPFIELGNFVVMPNHTHGILIIEKPDGWVETPKYCRRQYGSHQYGRGCRDAQIGRLYRWQKRKMET
jgi:REP element-mobilizing transposase RayT